MRLVAAAVPGYFTLLYYATASFKEVLVSRKIEVYFPTRKLWSKKNFAATSLSPTPSAVNKRQAIVDLLLETLDDGERDQVLSTTVTLPVDHTVGVQLCLQRDGRDGSRRTCPW